MKELIEKITLSLRHFQLKQSNNLKKGIRPQVQEQENLL